MEEKAMVLKQKNELTNLMKTVENNIEPKRFRAAMGPNSMSDELLDFDSGLPELSNSLPNEKAK